MKDWTFMVYLAGNNNLSDDMITAINGIKAGISSINNNIAFLAQYDCQHPAVPIHRYDFLQNPSGELVNEDFASIGHSIFEFVNWCVAKQPAKKYALILSGHGDGFQGKTLLLDESPHRVLTLPELRGTLEDIKSFLPDNRKIDILGFDSCVMNTLEGVYEMRDLAEVWIGSQGSIPNSGWAYERIFKGLGVLDENQLKDTKVVAKAFVNAFVEHSKSYSFGGRSVDISACNLAEVNDIAKNVNELSKTLISSLDERQNNNLIKRTVEKALLSSHWKSQTYMFDQTIDIRDFCENLQEECEQVQKNTSDIFAEIKQTQIANELSKKMNDIHLACRKIIHSISIGRLIIKSAFSGADYQYSYGVSLFFPWSYLAFSVSQESYGRLEFVRDTGKNWWNFLELYLELTMRSPRNKWESKQDYLLNSAKPTSSFAPIKHRDDHIKTTFSNNIDSGTFIEKFKNKYNTTYDRRRSNYEDDKPRSRDNLSNSRIDGSNSSNIHKSEKQFPNFSRQFPNSARMIDDSKKTREKTNPTYNLRDDQIKTRDDLPRGRGLGTNIEYFGRTKNFPLNLTTSGGEE